MANIFGKLKDYMLGNEEYDEIDEYEDYEEGSAQSDDQKSETLSSVIGGRSSRVSSSSYDSKIVNINTSAQMHVVISHPQTIDEAGTICDYIKSNKTVVVNLENTMHETAQRVVDFLGGVAYSLDGDIQCISNKIFIIAPKNVDITGQFKEELKANGLLFSFAQSYK